MVKNNTLVYSVEKGQRLKETNQLNTMHQDTAKKLFKKCHQFFRQGLSRSEISRKLHLARDTVIDWLSKPEWIEKRGWLKGRHRKYSELEEQRILEIRNRIVNKEKRYYWGRETIKKEYQKLYPEDPLPSDWFVDEIIRRHHLQIPEPKKRKKDIVRYLHYPEHLILQLGKIQESIDFIGRKYIDNHSFPLHFLGRYYLKPVGLYQVLRTENERNQVIIKVLREDWQRFSPPDIALLDNFSSISGPVKAKRFVSQTIQEILSWKVTPVFIPSRSPWAQGSIEGSNGIFGKKFWKRHRFTNLEQVDKELRKFNQENIERANLTSLSQSKRERKFKEEICFVRFAKTTAESDKYPSIDILNDKIYLPETYAFQYVFAKIDVGKEQLTVYVEKEAQPQTIHQQKFPLRFTKSKVFLIPNFTPSLVPKKVKNHN